MRQRAEERPGDRGAPLVSADMLEERGVVGPAEGQGSCAVLVGAEDAEAEQPPEG